MNKLDKIKKFANANKSLGLWKLSRAISDKFTVGVYVDKCTESQQASGNFTHILEIWYKRKDKWIKKAGNVVFNANEINL